MPRHRIGEWTVDLKAGRVVRRTGEEVRLQPLPWQLLALLIRAPDQLFGRELLTELLWPGVFVTQDALNQLIRRLRLTLGDEVVETVGRRGYRLGVPVEVVEPDEPHSGRIRAAPDRLVGRGEEIATVRRLLADGVRLVTLVGPGGVGKTRLGSEVAAGVACPVRVVADLGAAVTAEEVARAVAGALGRSIGGGDGPAIAGAALAALGPALLVLDEFEHAVAGAPATVSRWLGEAPELLILVTSRIVLGVRGERVVHVDPLPRPDAVALLCDRAGVPIPPHEAERLAEVLDGLPLALELAAARIRVVPPKILIGRLQALSGGGADRPERHRSLELALRASWTPLDDPHRHALLHLAVFEGSFGWDAIDAVLGLDALDLVQGLVDWSWVRADVASGRLSMFGSLRRWVRDQASADPLRTAELSHGTWFARMADDDAVDPAALEDLVAGARRAVARGDGPTAAGCALAGWRVLERRGPFALAAELFEGVMPLLGDPPTRLRVLGVLTRVYRATRQRDEGLATSERHLAASLATGDPATIGRAQLSAAQVLREFGDLGAALDHAGRALPLLDERDRSHHALALVVYATVLNQLGRPLEAVAPVAAAVAEYEALGDETGISVARAFRGLVAWTLGRNEDAVWDFDAALDLDRRHDNQPHEAMVVAWKAIVLATLGRQDQAIETSIEAMEVTRSLGQRYSVAIIQANLGRMYSEAGRPDDAERVLHEALPVLVDFGDLGHAGFVELGLGLVARGRGLHERALDHLDRAAGLVEDAPEPRLRVEVWIERATTLLDLGNRMDARRDLEAAAALDAALSTDLGTRERIAVAQRRLADIVSHAPGRPADPGQG